MIVWCLCSSESLGDVGKTTVDLEEDGVDAWLDKDILKTIKVTIHQHMSTGKTNKDEEEEVCGDAFRFKWRDQFFYS